MSTNRLAEETSPYLSLHKDNPVHWYTWGPEAFQEAEATGKPILLSIGYTACHWCHVMNAESFSDEATAALLNEKFVNVIVDREERPDIDQIYQAASQTMGYAGGWPLTIFLNPKGEPFFVGGFFPKEERFGQVPFSRVIEDVSTKYRDQQEIVTTDAANITQAVGQIWARDQRGPFDPRMLDILSIHVAQRFDIFYGGITGAPKFPNAPLVETLWRSYLRTGAGQFPSLVQTTLDTMCLSGIYDHVGGGFHRYVVDERWTVPHFEKMLYDNALMIELLTLVGVHNRVPLYKARVEETVAWVLRDMAVGDAFASSLDADVDGQEGAYYLWSSAEIDATLMGTFAQRFKDVYAIQAEGPFNGKNIIARTGGFPFPLPDADEALLKRQRELLLAARLQTRKTPLRDSKVLADANGQIIAALAFAGASYGNAAWVQAAQKAFAFVVAELSDSDRLVHSWSEGKKGHTGFAEDYAEMARAALALFEATSDSAYLDHAKRWAAVLNDYFWDAAQGGYCQTAIDDELLIHRVRTAFDGPSHSANGIMIAVLTKLFLATGDTAYRDRAGNIVGTFAGEVTRSFLTMGSYLNGLEVLLAGLQIVIIGPKDSPKTRELITAVLGRSLPNRFLLVVESGDALPATHPAYGKALENGQPTAYVCQHQNVSAPIANPVTLSQILQLPPRQQPQQNGRPQ